MAVPALPADVTSGGAAASSHMNSVLGLLEFLRDTRPVYKGRQRATSAATTDEWNVSSSTNTIFAAGSNGSFHYPSDTINVGGWSVNSADGNPESLQVPEPGVYRFTMWANFEGNTSGRRQMVLQLNGSAVEASRLRLAPSLSSTTGMSGSVTVDCAANDEIDVQVFQDSGSTLDVEVWLSAEWLVASP